MTLNPFNQPLIEQLLFLKHWEMTAFLEEIVGEAWQNIFSIIPEVVRRHIIVAANCKKYWCLNPTRLFCNVIIFKNYELVMKKNVLVIIKSINNI